MNEPLVSVCLPNLNTLRFLPERFDTIFKQTFQNWELLVYDSHSDDGAWDYIREVAAREPRIRAWQGPREGTPGSWNPCIQQAAGKYVYIATSDDTMAPDCLEKLVASLEAYSECDLAHCGLRLIDECGRELENWYWRGSMFASSSGELIKIPHLRIAPFDGLLHLSGRTVYTSITQLLIRRELFDKIGLFESRWGSVGDFNWDMRAGLVANTVHVPDTWGGWRIHAAQATSPGDQRSAEHERRIQEMVDHAIQATKSLVAPAIFERLQNKWSANALGLRHFLDGISERRDSKVFRRLFILRELLRDEFAASSHICARAAKRPIWPEVVRKWTRQIGVKTALVPL
jgi:glycosyltransferase involved in cell wall biosynthesis